MLYALHIAHAAPSVSTNQAVFTASLRHIYDGGGFGCMKKNEDYKGVNLRIRPAQAQRHTFRHLVPLQGLLQPSHRIQTVG